MNDEPDETELALLATARRRLVALGATIGISGGNCPVQIDGTIGGQPFYFRARGRQWKTWIGPGADVLNDSALFEERLHQPEGLDDDYLRFAAGWMYEHEAMDALRGSLERWLGTRA